jgi:CRP-like cAMP-binding protein
VNFLPENAKELLASTSLFRDMPREEVNTLLQTVPARIKHYNKDALVAFLGDRYENLYVILKGKLAAEITDYEDKTLLVETLSAGEMIASGILFAQANTLPVQLTALTDVELLILSKKTILGLCGKHEKVLHNFLQDMGNKISFLAGKIRFHQFNTLSQKTAVYFLELYARQRDAHLKLPYSIEKLAELFGAARPALSRVLSELVENGILERDGRNYVIRDLKRLRNLLITPARRIAAGPKIEKPGQGEYSTGNSPGETD